VIRSPCDSTKTGSSCRVADGRALGVVLLRQMLTSRRGTTFRGSRPSPDTIRLSPIARRIAVGGVDRAVVDAQDVLEL
jgi:hypothetical protein